MPPKSAALRPPSKTRYFKGKPGGAVADSDSEGDDADDTLNLKLVAQRGPAAAAAAAANADPSLVAGGAGRVITPGSLKDVKPRIKMDLASVVIPDGGVSKPIEEEESSEEESDEEEGKPAFVPKLDSSEYETDSEESEEEAKPAFRPVFVSKNARQTVSAEQAAKDAEELERKQEEEREQRKLDSKDLAGETIRRELAEKELNSDLIPDVDDTDGLDPEAEFDAWRVRELARLLRDQKAQAEADAEREEIERRRAMPEDQRMAEDMEFADGTRNREKTQMAFLQKYYHKGAFHTEGAEHLLNRDYTGMTIDQVDMSSLPSVLQVRDFGKRSRSKYTHLTAEDTSSGGWGTAHQAFGRPAAQEKSGCWNCGGDHNRADCPEQEGAMNNPNMIDGMVIPGMNNDPRRGGFGGRGRGGAGGGGGGRGGFGGAGASGANTSALGASSKWGDGGDRDRGGERERRDDRDGRSDRDRRDRDRGGDRERERERGGDRDRERRRSSRSPRRDSHSHSGRDRDRDRDRGGDRDRDRRSDRDRRDRDERRDRGDRGKERERDRGDRGDRDRRDRDRDRDSERR